MDVIFLFLYNTNPSGLKTFKTKVEVGFTFAFSC